jgi:hypothetical protein
MGFIDFGKIWQVIIGSDGVGAAKFLVFFLEKYKNRWEFCETFTGIGGVIF